MNKFQQYQVDASNKGFVPVGTEPARTPKWQVEVGPMGYGSPVIGTDGTVYVATLYDELVAVNPEGTIKWRRELTPGNVRGKVVSSPAVDVDGNSYVVTTVSRYVKDNRLGDTQRHLEVRSALLSFDAAGTLRWKYIFPPGEDRFVKGGYTLASPKVFRQAGQTFIALTVTFVRYRTQTDLVILDQAGDIIARREVSRHPPETITGDGAGIGELLEDVYDFLTSSFDPSGVPTNDTVAAEAFIKQIGLPQATPAIADFGEYQESPRIIVEDGQRVLAAFVLRDQQLVLLWQKTDTKGRWRSSPAVFANSVIAQTQYDRSIVLSVVADGRKLQTANYKTPKPVRSPIASFGRQLYLAADDRVVVLESDGTLLNEHILQGSRVLGAPILTANHMYFCGTYGFYTFNFDAALVAENSEFRGGVSNPAVADDRTIYAVDLRGTLWAFGGPGPRRRDHRLR